MVMKEPRPGGKKISKSKTRLIVPRVQIPKDKAVGDTARYITNLLSPQTTGQILRGKSPDLSNDPISFRRTPSPNIPPKSKRWIERIAAEIFSTRVAVTPEPREYDQSRVPTDPRKGKFFHRNKGSSTRRLCRVIHKRLVKDIALRHKIQLITAKVDTGRGRKKTSKKDLDSWKIGRGRRLNEEARRRRRRKVISTKRKKYASNRKCPTCGDYHYKKQKCSEQFRDAKIDLMVRQIYYKADSITNNMRSVWNKLEDLESTYQSMLLKVHRLQSNRVCLGSLTGLNYPGENHPNDCPCTKQKEKERLDRIRQEERERQILEEQKKQKEKRERERKKREDLIEARKSRFYKRMENQQKRLSGPLHPPTSTPAAHPSSVADGEDPPPLVKREDERKSSIQSTSTIKSVAFNSFSSSSVTSSFDSSDVTRLDEASSRRRRRKSTIYDRVIDQPGMNLLLMDGSIKSIKTEFSEEGGRVVESLVIEPVREKKLILKDYDEDEKDEEKKKTVPKKTTRVKRADKKEKQSTKPPSPAPPSVPFGDFLDMMEVF
ncbi:uncharacterized protein [Lepeophtheirus salmonis]|uniref:uncharacterized protein n=1 Tax=Lepeophtheirus salmonis TaxID=72036 RepID=UPI001AE4C5BF|nr:uncharacterized protein LOC121130568 [Lepeophtheirus salmonis]